MITTDDVNLKEVMEKISFDYSVVDQETSEFLKERERNIVDVLQSHYTKLGRELKESQDKLAGNNQYDGMFKNWYESLGFKKGTVYNLINRYNYIASSTVEQAEYMEKLPLGTTYEMSKPSADEDINQQVLDGDITTRKEYKELEKEKKEAEHMVVEQKKIIDKRDEQRKQLEEENRELRNKEPTTIEVPVEKVPDDYEYLKNSNKKLEEKLTTLTRSVEDKEIEIENATKEKEILERKAKLNEEDSKKYKQLKDEIENLSKEKDDLGRQIKSRTELSGLVVRIEHILKTELAPIKYSRAIDEASSDEIVTRNLRDIVSRVEGWCEDMYQYIPKAQANEDIIDVEVIDYE